MRRDGWTGRGKISSEATSVYDINAGGQIVGVYADTGGTIRGFVRPR
jgi:hypothetical protein